MKDKISMSVFIWYILQSKNCMKNEIKKYFSVQFITSNLANVLKDLFWPVLIYSFFIFLLIFFFFSLNVIYIYHCVKIVRIRSYSGPHSLAFKLNTKRYGVSLRIQSECWKMRIRITPNTRTFYAVYIWIQPFKLNQSGFLFTFCSECLLSLICAGFQWKCIVSSAT